MGGANQSRYRSYSNSRPGTALPARARATWRAPPRAPRSPTPRTTSSTTTTTRSRSARGPAPSQPARSYSIPVDGRVSATVSEATNISAVRSSRSLRRACAAMRGESEHPSTKQRSWTMALSLPYSVSTSSAPRVRAQLQAVRKLDEGPSAPVPTGTRSRRTFKGGRHGMMNKLSLSCCAHARVQAELLCDRQLGKERVPPYPRLLASLRYPARRSESERETARLQMDLFRLDFQRGRLTVLVVLSQ
jgi:hypothetical protein